MTKSAPLFTGVTLWKPIESAPQDGTIVLIGSVGKLGWFVTDAMFDGEWLLFDPFEDKYGIPCEEPQYWMPVPPKPLEVAA